jgi:hypothetical protein
MSGKRTVIGDNITWVRVYASSWATAEAEASGSSTEGWWIPTILYANTPSGQMGAMQCGRKK